MSATPGSDDVSGVLRPFEEKEPEPLPPVEPSKVVPEDRAPTVPDHITPDDVVNAPGEPPVEGDVPDLEASEPDIEDIWAAGEDEGGWAPAEPRADTDDVPAAEEGPGPTPAEEHGVLAPTVAETVTLPRTPFLVGMGVVGVALVALLALWQSAGGDGGPAIAAEDDLSPIADPAAEVDTDADVVAPVDAGPDLQAEIDGLNAQIGVLEADLASQPPPPLPGSSIHRIPVSAGSKFVSATDTSVAVVSPFGGYAAINPQTNVVTAAGTVSGGATRVVRTPTAVWVTNYTDGELVRIDPVANSVMASFAFPGPDGLAKYGATLLVASFDGGFLGQFDPATGQIVRRVDLGGKPTDVQVSDDQGVWVALFDTGEILRIDPVAMKVLDRVLVGAGPVGLTATEQGIWVANHNEGTVALIDSTTAMVIDTIEVGEGPTELRGANGQLWVTVTDAGDLIQIDQETREIVTRTPLGGPGIGGGPVGIDTAAGSLWIAMDGEASVVRVALPE